MKKVVIALLVMITLVTNPSKSVYATTNQRDSDGNIIVYELNDDSYHVEESSGKTHVLGETRGDFPPTTFFDLTICDYNYQLINVTGYVYTSAYFNPDSQGNIAISVNGLNAGGGTIEIRVYKWYGIFGLFDPCVHSWIGDPQSIQGLCFPSLDPSAKYYFEFLPYTATTINGSGVIHHP